MTSPAARLAAAGPRAAGQEREYEQLVEMIHEGSRLHYGSCREHAEPDPDLALLRGDDLYARGLARLAELGDLAAVSELADLISLVAQAEADGDAELTDAAWAGAARAIGWGTSHEHEAAKALARAGDRAAVKALQTAAARPGK